MGMAASSTAGKSMSVNGIKPVPTQPLAGATWQGMQIQARAMTAVPFVVYNGTREQMIKPPPKTSFHLMVMLNDAHTGVAIPYASVWATIKKAGKVVYDERMWPMISALHGPALRQQRQPPRRGRLPDEPADQPAGVRTPRRVPERVAASPSRQRHLPLEAGVDEPATRRRPRDRPR